MVWRVCPSTRWGRWHQVTAAAAIDPAFSSRFRLTLRLGRAEVARPRTERSGAGGGGGVGYSPARPSAAPARFSPPNIPPLTTGCFVPRHKLPQKKLKIIMKIGAVRPFQGIRSVNDSVHKRGGKRSTIPTPDNYGNMCERTKTPPPERLTHMKQMKLLVIIYRHV